MENNVVGNLNSTSVVTVKRGRRGLRNAQVREETTKPDNFNNSMSHSTTTITELRSHPSASNSALFLRHTSAGFVTLILYVDEMIITGFESSVISKVKQDLFCTFEMKDLGPLRYFFGIELNTTDGVSLDDPTLYHEFVGCLVYLTVTHPDLAYVVHVISQFVSTPCSLYWAVLVQILRYLRDTILQDLLLSSTSSLDLMAYADADWAGDVTDRKSTSGFCLFLGDSLISWKSKKQTVVASSTTEAEYYAMAHAIAEVIWLRCLLFDLGVPQSSLASLYCDNRSAI
ncbi:uncharacterized protein LOC114265622 [Camellia sinensis]|uniref:uncharacterized protein LOC114265622 n=1 Tax=Camellia sinensis TaxID=4442 RepID=UPI00103582F0|nr:uncharacterized protein LOC114265622 [Camellia sinensis]